MNRERLSIAADAAERIILIILYVFFCYRVGTRALQPGGAGAFLILASEGLVLFFVLIRKRTASVSLRSQDWIVGFGGTLLPLLIIPAGAQPFAPAILCLWLVLTGFVINIHAKLTLRRRFGVVAANRGIVTSGPYRYVRHPMYMGYLLTHLGSFLLMPSVWNAVVYVATWGLQVARIFAEERLLSSDPDYQELCRRVRFRLVPAIF